MTNKLGADFLRAILAYNPRTGIFRWRYRHDQLQSWNTQNAGKIAGCRNRLGYIVISINRKQYFAHRLAHLYMTKKWPPKFSDHANKIRSDNRWSNLRPANRAQNTTNSKMYRHNSSGYRGVRWDAATQKWKVTIGSGGNRHLGYFNDAQTAARIYDAAARRLHGEFAHLNFP